MKNTTMPRRELLKSSLAAGAGLAFGIPDAQANPLIKGTHNFKFCLNTSTIREQKLGLIGEMETAAKAGFDGIEVWINTLEEYVKNGGKLADVKKRATDLNLVIEDAIGFSKWIVDDETERGKALEQNKKEMGMLAEIGCKRIAAPPVGATTGELFDLHKVATRYGKLLELGNEMGVIPQLELWGFSANLHLVGEVLYVAAESGQPNASILMDVFHLYKGGSNLNSLQTINGNAIHIFHMNDYPATPIKADINDSFRVFPGDGVAPLNQILKTLNSKGTPIALSLEVFNKEYWKMDALTAVKMGLAKMKTAVAKALV